MKTVILDGVPTEISDEGAAAVVKMEQALIGAAAAVSAKEEEISALKTDLASELDAAVTLRIKVIDDARVVQGAAVEITGRSEADIRRSAVASRLSEAWVADKDDAFIQAAFETLLALSGTELSAVLPRVVPHLLAKDVAKAYEASAASMKSDDKDVLARTNETAV